MERGEMGSFLIILLHKARFHTLTVPYLRRLVMSITHRTNNYRRRDEKAKTVKFKEPPQMPGVQSNLYAV